MGQFLRDQRLKNLKVNETVLGQLNDFFLTRVTAGNQGIPENDQRRIVFFYVIRFDEKGYRFVDFADVLGHYRAAEYVERIILTMDSASNRATQGLFGTHFELRLDARDPNSCWLSVTADQNDWVDATFSGIADILSRQRTFSGYVRTQWTPLVIQIVGVGIGFLLSLWAAVKVAPQLKIDNAFVVTFFFALLIYSNIWAYINTQIGNLLNYTFPNLRFHRTGKGTLHWFGQALVGGVFAAFLLFLLDQVFALVGAVLSNIIK
jgi:hypothetical protein